MLNVGVRESMLIVIYCNMLVSRGLRAQGSLPAYAKVLPCLSQAGFFAVRMLGFQVGCARGVILKLVTRPPSHAKGCFFIASRTNCGGFRL